MKIKITFLFLFISSGFLFSQIINIPDPVFKVKLIEEGVDTNNDGEIQESEALAVLDLDISAYEGVPQIESSEGIQYFSNLEYLNCHGNLLATIDVSSLTNLIEFSCADNQLTTLDVTALTNLVFLKAYGNELTSINVAGLINLTYLWVDGNQLETLDVSTLQNLHWLYCSNNLISNIDISNLVELKYLWANGNQFNTLDFLPLNNLESIVLHYNNLTNIDVNHLNNLEVLILDHNLLAELDVTNLINLREISVRNNFLSELDCSTTAAELINCDENPDLHTINVQNNVISISDPIIAFSGFSFFNLPNLEYICMDPGEEQALSHSGYDPENVTVFTGPNCTLGMDEFSKEETYIYPNPVIDTFNINTNIDIVNYTLFDITGKQISQSNTINNIKLSVSTLYKEIYFLKLESISGNKTTIRFIKD